MGISVIQLVVVGTLITGAANSLFTKYQDNQCVRHCNSPDFSKHKNFEQPAIQTFQMFVGEFAMILVFLFLNRYNKRRGDYTPLDGNATEGHQGRISLLQNIRLAIPALCDLCCTTLLNIGLIYVPVSIYQMMRGSVVLFVAIMSVLFLKRRITRLEWISLVFVTLGVFLVGLSGSTKPEPSEPSGSALAVESSTMVLFGILLIVIGEVLQAFQFVIEEHILEKHPIVPLQIVYTEGFYGFSILFVVVVFLYFVVGAVTPKAQFKDSPFNIVEAVSQVTGNREVLLSSVCIMISIAAFNYCGITITHQVSATARSTIDTCRTLLVWIVAILMGWESFHLLQCIGFAVLVFGTLCFNGVLEPETWSFVPDYLKADVHPGERLINVIDEVDEPIERM
ncbi:putative UDP-galactose transporter [Scheffersomyces xylosifermentans]|uniref:putative UDP-galactose transporter n=1 Tax=Scheffersomyces xylosifermentans TaxID=1304137 RepID=UPI00315CEABE